MQERQLAPKQEFLFWVVAEDGVRHVVVGADLLTRVRKGQDWFQMLAEAIGEVAHGRKFST